MDLGWWDSEDDPRELERRGVEVWARIGEASRYAISNLGNAMSVAQGAWKKRKPHRVSSGYLTLGLIRDDGSRVGGALLHRLVVLAFDGKAPSTKHTDVRHLDGNKENNRLTNLIWGTRSENMLDVVCHRKVQGEMEAEAGIEQARKRKTWYGGRTWDQELVEKVLHLERSGYLTVKQAADLLGVSADVIENIVRKSCHTHFSFPKLKKQKRRTKCRKEEIRALVREGKNAAQINDLLGETLTPQGVYYYRLTK